MRLIDADELKEYILRSVPNWSEDREIVIDCIANSPTIEERKRGEWMTTLYHISDDGDELYEHYCSECKKTVMISSLKKGRFNYCPNCGADMRGENDGE